jgi:hypothetical protein
LSFFIPTITIIPSILFYHLLLFFLQVKHAVAVASEDPFAVGDAIVVWRRVVDGRDITMGTTHEDSIRAKVGKGGGGGDKSRGERAEEYEKKEKNMNRSK